MKLKKYLSFLVICLVLSMSLLPTISHAATIKLNAQFIQLDEGETYQLKLLHTKKEVTWKSSDKSIAKVSKNGKVTAISEGATKITATSNKKKYTCTVSVKPIIENPPDIYSYLFINESVYGSSSVCLLAIENKGNKTLTITSEGFIFNSGYPSLSKSVSLIEPSNGKNITLTDKIKIKAGDFDGVMYVSDWLLDETFWLDEDTELYFNFIYDGIKYHSITDSSGTTSYNLGYFD